LNGYLKSPEKFRQDYNTLLEFTKKLNDKLHVCKIPENQRALLISSILIALEDDAFKTSYSKKTTPKSLADFLAKTVSEKLEEANISGKKLENLNMQFGFIKTDSSLSVKDKVLKELIDEIDENINKFIKTHEYFDVLGQLYIEFLRYANSDKGLGIVLTPPHITDFFAEIAQVNKNSIAYDNCVGTGGFLIAAMKKMIEDAKGDNDKVKAIKQAHLIGTEYQSHIYALAVSNMYIHQDGKTNIQNGSCFDADIIKTTKAKKPTVGFLNPPYKGDKKNDIDELAFVLNNLECLVDGGTCVAIVPMQSALAQSGKTHDLKKQLLAKHTLEAVFSMPNELFFNSKVNVVTCIMVFTAHKPHPVSKKTFFGYFKDDGFDKRKNLGRLDVYDYWKDRIKAQWLTAYINRESIQGLSVVKAITANDEWCAEAYMETDYSGLTFEDFENTIREYAASVIINRTISLSAVQSLLSALPSGKDIKAISAKTPLVPLNSLFEIRYGVNMELYKFDESKSTHPNAIPFVSRSERNNGVAAYVEKRVGYEPNPAHTLSVAGGGSVLATFYQDKPYYSGRDLYYLAPKRTMSVVEMLYYSMVIKVNRYRYSYGRQANKTFKHILIPDRMPSEFGIAYEKQPQI
jgi:type I restriction-modification system DNA methylase subunit